MEMIQLRKITDAYMRHLPQWVKSVPIYVAETLPPPHPQKFLYVENDFQDTTIFADRFLYRYRPILRIWWK